ncbi:MAG: CBS domain-containing protein [Candidatus Omnitrophica bacterium]|nr:CBS domain-containing protein [Candidatus Omnitrophota bacterium]
MLVKNLMTSNVITITPDSSIKEVGRILKEKRISGIPVVDNDGELVGIITLTDLFKILGQIYHWRKVESVAPELRISEMFEKEKEEAKVASYMTKAVFTVEEEEPIEAVMDLMFERNVHTIPVTRKGKLVGVIGQRDLIYSCF